MTLAFALPFLTLPDEVVNVRDWMIGDPSGPLELLPSQLENWDYARDLEIDTRIGLNFAAAAEALQLPASELKLAVTVKVGSGLGRFPRRMERKFTAMVDEASPDTIDIKLLLAGDVLSGRLHVQIEILLAAVVSGGSELSPKLAGSRLWSHISSVHLEDGGDTRFPMEMLSFRKAFPKQRQEFAPWYLSWRPGALHADFSGSARLYVNTDHENLAQRVVDGDSATLQAILGDVMVQICVSALNDADLQETLDDCEEGSVASQVAGWLELAFPEQTLEAIRSTLRATPGAFHSAILAAADMGESG